MPGAGNAGLRKRLHFFKLPDCRVRRAGADEIGVMSEFGSDAAQEFIEFSRPGMRHLLALWLDNK
jgi:hypothetical protein